MKYIFSHIFILLLLVCQNLTAQTYHSRLLSELGSTVGFQTSESIHSDTYFDAGTAYGMPLTARTDDNGGITHLGLKLFPTELKTQVSPLVYDFVERYFLKILSQSDATQLKLMLKDDKFLFTKGNVALIKRLTASTPFSISRTENKFYELTWSENGQPFLAVAFPIQCELLLGMSQDEIEKTVSQDIFSTNPKFEDEVIQDYELFKDSIYRSAPVENFNIDKLNTCSYYVKDTLENYHLVMSEDNIDLSVLNLFHRTTPYDINIVVTQQLYGKQQDSYAVTLQQLLAFFREKNLTVYTGIEGESETHIQVLIIAESKDLGYNHLLSVLVPKGFLTSNSSECLAKLTAYIPVHNLKAIYQENKKKK